MPRISFKATQSERYRASAVADDLPPIFRDSQATKAIAILAHLGPVNMKIFKQMMGGKGIIAAKRLRDMEDAGIILTAEVPELWGTPKIYGLNRGHAGYAHIRNLGKSLWENCVAKRVRTVPDSPFVFRKQHRRKANGAIHAWNGRITGRILHLLAELRDDEEIYIEAASRLLRSRSIINTRFDRFAGFTLITEHYAETRRYVRLNEQYPAYKELRAYLRWANATAFPQYKRLMERYRKERSAGEHDLAFVRQRGREQKRIARS